MTRFFPLSLFLTLTLLGAPALAQRPRHEPVPPRVEREQRIERLRHRVHERLERRRDRLDERLDRLGERHPRFGERRERIEERRELLRKRLRERCRERRSS